MVNPRQNRRKTPTCQTSRDVGLREGYRSGLEESLGQYLTEQGMSFTFEEEVIRYDQPAKERKYTPDFVLSNGIIIETKGRFITADRQKHILIKKQHPTKDIRFVFSNPNQKIRKGSKTSYGMWCEKHGFMYSKKLVPREWLNE